MIQFRLDNCPSQYQPNTSKQKFGAVDDTNQWRQVDTGHKHQILKMVNQMSALKQNSQQTYEENLGKMAKDELDNMLQQIQKSFSSTSDMDIKTQVFLINKLAKDEEFKEANSTFLVPLWDQLAQRFSEYRSLTQLSKEQFGILMWSFGHLNLEVLKHNQRLWNSLEMYITNKIGVGKFNNFTLSQFAYGLMKSGQGSQEFWEKLGEGLIDRAGVLDRLGIAIVINSFGRSHEGSLGKVLPAFKGVILHSMQKDFNHKEILLILSGIASEITTKSKKTLDSQHYLPIYEAYMQRVLAQRDLNALSYSQIATIVWAYTTIKGLQSSQTKEFWEYLIQRIEEEQQQQSLYHTIIIAKGLSYIDQNRQASVHFWKSFKSHFQQGDSIQQYLSQLGWSEFSSILFILSQVKLLDSPQEWALIVNAFRQKLTKSYDQDTVIRSITSLSLANVLIEDDFWQELFEIVDKRIKPEMLDSFLKMNLLWSMARNKANLMPQVQDSLSSRLLSTLSTDLDRFLSTNQESLLFSFIPNLAWSLKSLDITSDPVWTRIDQSVIRLQRQFGLEETISLASSYQDVRECASYGKAVDAIEKRTQGIKEKGLSSEEEYRQVKIIEDFIAKIRAKQQRDGGKQASQEENTAKNEKEDTGIQSDDEQQR